MKIKNSEYIKYLSLLLEKDFGKTLSENKYSDIFRIINILKDSNNLFRDVYILSNNKNLEIISTYLLFIFKKLEEGEITFENLAENLEADSVFLKNELINLFEPGFYEKNKELSYTDIDELKESEIKKWKPITIQNETLEEEFLNSDSDIVDSENEFSSSTGLSLIKKEDNILEQAKVFSLPSNEITDEVKQKEEEIRKQDPEEIFELPEEQSDSQDSDLKKEAEEIESSEEHEHPETEDNFCTQNEDENIKEPTDKKFPKEKKESKSLFSIFKKHKEKPEKPKDKIITTINKEPQKILISPDAEIMADESYKEKTKITEKEENDMEKELINRAFEEYQAELKSKNIVITKGLGDLYDFCARVAKNAEGEDFQVSDVQIGDREKNIIEKIINYCLYMEEYSRKMSFEIITTVYNTIYLSLNKIYEAGYGIDQETINLFLDAIILIQRLIEGGEYSGFKNTLMLIEGKRNNLINKQKEKEEIQNLKKEKQELERKLLEKYSNAEQRNDIKKLKNHILNLEKHFTTVKSIEGNFRIYESLRALSPSFIDFKKIVELSLRLKKEDLAKLAEASYVFIKHVQNYRINPQSQHILEILDDIINSMKLLFLEKQLKEIHLFIKYLNNPENVSRGIRK